MGIDEKNPALVMYVYIYGYVFIGLLTRRKRGRDNATKCWFCHLLAIQANECQPPNVGFNLRFPCETANNYK